MFAQTPEMCAMNGNEDRDIQSYAMSDSYVGGFVWIGFEIAIG